MLPFAQGANEAEKPNGGVGGKNEFCNGHQHREHGRADRQIINRSKNIEEGRYDGDHVAGRDRHKHIVTSKEILGEDTLEQLFPIDGEALQAALCPTHALIP